MSNIVFVGNVPYNYTEEQLIEVFQTVGEVVGFRLVFERETGKPRGYGFCEFLDHETAASAVRNLNGYEVGGRPLRIDLAESDPNLVGKTTTRGELLDGDSHGRNGYDSRGAPPRSSNPDAFLSLLPPGITLPPGTSSLDVISNVIAGLRSEQMMDILRDMKTFVLNSPAQARSFLVAHPQVAHAFFQAMLVHRIVDPAVLERMMPSTASTVPAPSPAPHRAPPPAVGQVSAYPPHQPAPYYNSVPPAAPPAAVNAPPAVPNLSASQQDMIVQVLQLTPAQIESLPPEQQQQIRALRAQLLHTS